MSRTSTSPASPSAPAWIVSATASSTVMKKRVTSGSVTVIGPPFSTWCWNVPSTDPFDPRTLPKRTETIAAPGGPGGIRR